MCIAKLLIEYPHARVAWLDEEAYLFTSLRLKSPLNLLHQLAANSLRPIGLGYSQMIDPSSASVVASQHCANQIISLNRDQKEISISLQCLFERLPGI